MIHCRAAAKELLKAIRDQASKASDLKLQLAQAYSLIVSAETTAELVDEGEAEPVETWCAPITAD